MHSAVNPKPVAAMLAMRRIATARKIVPCAVENLAVLGLACSQKKRQACRSRSSRNASSSLDSFEGLSRNRQLRALAHNPLLLRNRGTSRKTETGA